MVEQIHKTTIYANDEVWKKISSKRAFQDSYEYLRDRYNLKSSYSSFEKNNLNKGFLHDDEDFDLIVMSVLVGMGRIDDAYTEANHEANGIIQQLENELEQLNDELGDEMTKDKGLKFVPFEEKVKLDAKLEEWHEIENRHIIKLTLKEKAGFILQAIKEAFYKTFK